MKEDKLQELDMKHRHKLKYMPLWIILTIGLFILMLALSVNLTADASKVQMSCKFEGLQQVPTYQILLYRFDYIPYNLDCVYVGPPPANFKI